MVEVIVGFIIETLISNSIFVLFFVGLIAVFVEPLTKSLNPKIKILSYGIMGSAIGLYSYSTYDMPNESLTVLEVVVVGSLMLIFSLILGALIVRLSGKKALFNRHKQKESG